jgi:hypothetical protein
MAELRLRSLGHSTGFDVACGSRSRRRTLRKFRSTPPFVFCLLVLPYGMSFGFVSVTLPFALTRAEFPVAVTASIVALGLSANVWRFLWGPLADLMSARA